MLRQKIRVVVVDDSAFMRKSISIMLESDDSIEIVGSAKDGLEGYEMVKKLRPDIVTLDIEMPRMDGLTSLKKIMRDCPTPVIMVSSLTTEGAESTLKAMELGAVDFIPKELSYVNVNIISIKEDLIRKVKAIVLHKRSQDRINRLQKIRSKSSSVTRKSSVIPNKAFGAIAIGISTGGPLSLQKVIPKIDSKLNIPIFIVQHMPPRFTKSLAERLNALSSVEVKEAMNNEIVRDGVIYIAPGGFHMTVKNGPNGNKMIRISENPSDTLHRPSVDVMLDSVVDVYKDKAVSVIMTGMGKDGLNSVGKLKTAGGFSLAQNENSCVIYGMPKAIVDAGYADNVLHLDEIANNINKVFNNGRTIRRTHI